MLTTIHDDCMTTKVCRTRRVQGGQEEIRKPVVVEQYNQFMGGVDRSDQLLSYYGFADRTVKWWRREVFYLLDMAVVNAYVLHTHKQETQFRIELALLETSTDVSEDMPVTHGRLPRPLPPPSQDSLNGTSQTTSPAHHLEIGDKQSVCICSKKRGHKRKTTTYMCQQCRLPMCIIPCFELYHTKVDPQRYL